MSRLLVRRLSLAFLLVLVAGLIWAWSNDPLPSAQGPFADRVVWLLFIVMMTGVLLWFRRLLRWRPRNGGA
jgi:hypothetical protein